MDWRDFLDDTERTELSLCDAAIRIIRAQRAEISRKHHRMAGTGCGRDVRYASWPAKKLRIDMALLDRTLEVHFEKRREIQQRASERARHATRNRGIAA